MQVDGFKVVGVSLPLETLTYIKLIHNPALNSPTCYPRFASSNVNHVQQINR
jgi:hypothetical protein